MSPEPVRPLTGRVDSTSASIRAAIDAAHPVTSQVDPEPAAPEEVAPEPTFPEPDTSEPAVPERSTEGLLADGIYRDPTVGRWTRLALASFAAIAVFAGAAVSSSGAAFGVLVAIAVVLLVVRSVLKRPRLVVRPEGVVVVRRIGSSMVDWSNVVAAGAAPAPPPLGQVERVLAIRVSGGRELRVSSLRDALDRRTGEAPRVAELAHALVARAEWSNSPQ